MAEVKFVGLIIAPASSTMLKQICSLHPFGFQAAACHHCSCGTKFLHKILLQQNQKAVTPETFRTKEHLLQKTFTLQTFYTKQYQRFYAKDLCTPRTVTPNSLYTITRRLPHQMPFYAKGPIHQKTCKPNRFYIKLLLQQTAFMLLRQTSPENAFCAKLFLRQVPFHA